MIAMRTTLNLDEDLVFVLKKAARRGGQSFTAVVNETLRAGLTNRGGQTRPRRYRIEPASLGGARAELDLDRALRLADEWLGQPFVESVGPGEKHWPLLRTLLAATGSAGNLTSDAHLAALSLENGAEICSTDRDFGRFPGVRHLNPLA
jgi:predicted nucleic acid-binding protein